MADVRSGHLVFGVGLVLMGYALLVISLAEQAQRAAAPMAACGPALESTAAVQPATSRKSSEEVASAPSPVVATPIPSSAPAASIAAIGSDPAMDADGRLFKFSPGGAVMSREEVQRLLALGKVIARRPGAKVAIDGFGDLPGADALMVGIAKHRAKVAQTLLMKAGVTEDRVTTAFVDMGLDARLARSIRITTMPPLSEIEKP
jgi:outer membrane protein OmpA-like peptidoglycan-associated protein